MVATPWNAKFETVLRQSLPGLGTDAVPAADLPMEAYGLDSIALMGMVGALESAFGVSLAGQLTVPVRSLTAGHLWGIVSTAMNPVWDQGRAPAAGAPGFSTASWAVA
ncbi:acyl carrier protein [Streptomyces beijiangensis]|uniref:Acyl carrier protein n=1 Tax=Streptomyces beijiangensis TaxID=163361 RepID=A0A939F625_9ACTN|nr:acyl carrier protein [Streptomyces beijiangensis]MBO0512379.1 acyl carrier protein [Streptomyces beijiangensis]